MTATYSSLARWRISSLGFMMSSMSRLQYNIINTLQKMIFQASQSPDWCKTLSLLNQSSSWYKRD